MQGAEDEVEGSVLTYVTETEFRKQRSRSPSCNSLHVRKHTPFALTLSSLHLGYSAKSLPKKRCFFGERPFCKGLD